MIEISLIANLANAEVLLLIFKLKWWIDLTFYDVVSSTS